MSEQKLENEFIEIEKLENKDFFIPSYQRGYRWGEREIKELLEDINDFMVKKNEDKKENDFYCLQPIVVKEDKKDKSKYRVIDGQQRLTTIFLIIKYLENKNYFKIEYETRKKSFEFLAEIKDKYENSTDNIDFHHFSEAYKNIKGFFEKNNNIDRKQFYDTLTSNCKVLWYEISEDEIEQDVFVRLNIGKIPLSEEENIKSLFLSKTDGVNYDDLKYRARLWYENEKKLRAEDDYSYLVLNKINREYIEKDEGKHYILNDDFLRIKVYLHAITDKAIRENSKNELFNYFHVLKKNNQLDKEWDKLKKCMSSLQGFASSGGDDIERDIFHYIGFLILHNIMNINSIYKLWSKFRENDLFSKALLEEIRNHISSIIDGKGLRDYINDLEFNEENKKEISKILALFNIAILLKDKGSKNYFDFNRFQLEDWSLEHIHAQNSKSIISLLKKDKKNNENNSKENKKEEIIKWLEEINKYIEEDKENKDLKKRIKEAIEDIKTKTIKNDEGFDKILKENNLLDDIDENFKNNSSLQGIGNLCLLDKTSNSSFGNDIFSKKKEKIEELVNTKKFIPIATKQVFNKHFSKNKTHKDLFMKEDRDDYMEKIIETLKDYIQ